MKRVSEIGEKGSGILGSKKVKLSNGIDESSGASERRGEEEGVLVEIGGMDFEPVDRNRDLFGNSVPDNLDGPSLGGLRDTNKWDFDINFEVIFGNEKEPNGLPFDLNVPVCKTLEGGRGQECLKYNQGPVINENKVEVIEIASDDSDDEVEVISDTYGCNAKGKEIQLGLPCHRMENLSLGLGIVDMDNIVGESSLMGAGERKSTKEEQGKADAVNPWLSLKASYSIDLDYQTDDDDSIRITYPAGNVEPGTWQPAALAPSSEFAERAPSQAEQALRHRDTSYRETLRETAKRYARVNFLDQNRGNESSGQRQKPPALSSAEQLGNSPGPFSEALKMVRERTSKQAAQKLIEWKPLEENRDQRITAPFIPSLLNLSLRALAQNAEGIVSLELVPDNLRRRLTDLLCDMRKMNVNILNLLVEGCPTEIRIKNCSWLSEKQFQQTFGNCQTKDLRVLQLDLCGQCVLDFAFKDALAQPLKSFSSLAILSLRGACHLSDGGIKDLITSASALQSLNLGQCNLLTSDAINFIADSLGSNLRELYIDDCQKINAMLILPAFKKLKCLEVISVAGLSTVTDQFVNEMVTLCGQSIKELDLANCLELTDHLLKIIGGNCADLCSLNISNLHNLTDLGMEYLANGCKSIQKFKLCRNRFSDEAVAAFLESSGESLTELSLNNVPKVGPNTALSLSKRSRKLLSLDISWCRGISNEALGLIVDSCSSLKLLKVFGCSQIKNIFSKGHSNQLVRIIGLNSTPILDHVNLLEPEEELLRYSPLTVCTEV